MSPRHLIALTLVLALALPLSARTKPKAVPTVDPDYIFALATATKFLYAWQTHDQETAALLLSDHAREHIDEGALAAFFSAHTEQAYELSPGRKLAHGHYQFPVALYTAPADPHHWTHPRTTSLQIVHTPKGDWLVDNLP